MIDQERIDNAIARQLARSMKMNAKLQARVHALRSALETAAIAAEKSTELWATGVAKLCRDTLRIDHEHKDDQ